MPAWVAFVTPDLWSRVLEDGGAAPLELPRTDAPSPRSLSDGDLLLCYVEEERRWVGALLVQHVLSRDMRNMTEQPLTVQVRPVAALPLDQGTPLRDTPLAKGLVSREETPFPEEAADEIMAKLYDAGGAWLMAGPLGDDQAGEDGGEEANGGAEAEPPDGGETELTRTPHLDVPDKVAPGETFQALVYADREPGRKGETTREIKIKTPAGVEAVELSVWLAVSEHFELTEKQRIKPFPIVVADSKTEPVAFGVRAKPNPPAGEPGPAITAHFAYGGRGCGSVGRGLQVGEAPPKVRPRLPRGIVETDQTATEPDLTVHVTAASLDETRRFTCVVTSPHLPAYEQGKHGEWRLVKATGDLVREHMESFTDESIPPAQLTNRLRGVGVELFELSPPVFREAFWSLIDAKKPLRTIAIKSQEPYVPWELMVPKRDGDPERRPALGVGFVVGRWVAGEGGSPPQRIALSDSCVVAPRYQGAKNFDNAPAETELVCGLFPGRPLDPPASWTALNDALVAGGASLFHFICHGADDGRSLRLGAEAGKNEDGKLTLAELEDWEAAEEAFRKHRPLVFLNACEVGRVAPSLLGTDGFAARFGDLGASCVIAPLWSVEDGAAHEVAELFYQAIEAGKQSGEPANLAAILSGIRQKAYDQSGSDTHAAYCFFGDPLARAAPP
jgi:CHAT domain